MMTTTQDSAPQSRSSEFVAGTGTNERTMQSSAHAGFTNTSVLSPIPMNNGSSDDTFQKNLLHSIYNAR